MQVKNRSRMRTEKCLSHLVSRGKKKRTDKTFPLSSYSGIMQRKVRGEKASERRWRIGKIIRLLMRQGRKCYERSRGLLKYLQSPTRACALRGGRDAYLPFMAFIYTHTHTHMNSHSLQSKKGLKGRVWLA